jgi:hypothetical protein
MRKFIFKVSLCVSLSLLPFAEVQAGSTAGIQVDGVQNTSAPGIKVDMTKVLVGLKEGFNQIMNATGLNAQKAEEQALAGQTASDVHATSVAQAASQNAATTARQGHNVTTVINNSDIAENNCSLLTTSRGMGPAYSRASAYADARNASTMAAINNEAGTTFENGLVDGMRKLFEEETVALCSAQGNGAKNVFCGGDGTNVHLSASSVLNDRAITDDEIAKVDYFEKLMTQTRTILDVSPDVLDDPKTDGKGLFIEAERLKAEMSIFNTVLNNLIANNKVDGTSSAAVTYLKEILEEGDFLDAATREKLLPGGQGSHMGQLEALAIGFMNPNYSKQKFFTAEKAYLSSILFQNVLNNYIQIQQMKLLEAIALSTSATVVVNREPAIESLNVKVRRANSGN